MKDAIKEISAVIFIVSVITLFIVSIWSYIEKTQLEIEVLKHELAIYAEQDEIVKKGKDD